MSARSSKIFFCTASVFSATLGSIFLAVWRLYFPTTLLFDQFCLITALIFVVNLLFLITFSKGKSIHSSRTVITLVSLVTALTYFTTVQYTILAIDRSRSFYVLSWVDQGWINVINNELRIDPRINTAQVDLDVNNLLPLNQRLDEQLSRGLISRAPNRLQLTWAGKVLLNTSNFAAKVFNLQGWWQNTNTESRY
jgi:hypothetical protein